MFAQSCYYFRYALILVRDRSLDRRTPVLSFAQIKHHFDFDVQTICAIAITFVDAEYITNFKDTCFDSLNIVA